MPIHLAFRGDSRLRHCASLNGILISGGSKCYVAKMRLTILGKQPLNHSFALGQPAKEGQLDMIPEVESSGHLLYNASDD